MNAVDKYEYKLKTEQLLELMEEGSYRKAAEIADSIDWKRVRNASMLASVSDVYEKNREYEKSYEVLNLAYRRAEGSRKIISRLCTLALKTGNVDEAIDYYDDFMQIAPKDPNQYILRYQILRAQKAPIEQQIEALEEYKKSEYIEEWAYELAKLYQEAGMTAECLEECDDLILWFSEGQYVYKAMELKMQYKPLTPSQQEKYDRRYEKLSEETEEMPDIFAYAEARGADVPVSDETGAMELPVENSAGDPEPDAAVSDAQSPDAGDKDTAAGTEVEEAGSQSPEPAVKKKKIGDTMPLDEALRRLLHPESEEKQDESGQEPELGDLEQAIDEIESVVDIDMVRQAAEEKKKKAATSNGEMTEIIPEDNDQIAGQMNLEDILTDWEGTPAAEDEAPAVDDLLAADAEEIEEDDLLTADAEDMPEEEDLLMADAEDMPVEDFPMTDAEETAEKPLAADVEEVPEEGEPETDMKADQTDEHVEEGDSIKGETMEEQKTKKTEPILPPDIQRMIDEIEGVIPPEEEKKPAPVKRVEKEEPHENMGKVADSLRLDDFDEEDLLDEELDEAEEYFDEEDEEPDGAEEYFDGEDEELDEAEDFFDGEDEEPDEAEEYFDEEDEELDEAEDFFDEEGEELDEDEEDFLEESGEYAEDDEFDADTQEVSDWDEEFRVNPEHADMEDDREIPDDDDDNMDILSATTPLSRKETAKMIATGKTAPLPLDEISDALSMSDTGFIVHGRYDLGVQSGIGTRAGLTEEQKKLFSYFVPVRGMSEQLVDVLEQDKNCTNRQGTSKTGNLLIVGNKGNGKTVLAVDVVKAIQKQRDIHQGKVAIVTGDSLNKKKIGDIFDKLYGGALIIEKAGKMNEKTVARLNKAMEKDTGELLVVLEEQRKPIDRLLSSNREFRRKFTSRLEVPIFINDELVTFGQTYAQENGYRIDEMGILALYSKIDSLQREDHAVTVAEVKGIMDDAIQHSQKASAKKLVKRVFGRSTDEADRIFLSEKDFNI